MSPAATFTVACTAKPAAPALQITAPTNAVGNTILFDGLKFPRVTMRATNQNPTSPLTYSWTFNGVAASQMSNLAVSYGGTPGTQSEVSFTPPAVGGVTKYTVRATANDGCSSSAENLFELNLRCDGSLVAAIEPDKVSTYDYVNSIFSLETFTGSATVWPYQNVNGAKKQYNWGIKYFQTATSAGSQVTTGLSGVAAETLTIRPAFVGTYQISLTVNDGCNTNTRTTSLIARCTTTAIARVSPQQIRIEWNSFASKYRGAFEAVTMDGSSSTGHPNVALTYNWSPTDPKTVLVAQQGAVSLNTNKVTYTPTASGTFTFQLTVNNGPCPKSVPFGVSVNALCNVINAVVFGLKTTSTSVRWDGTRFPTVCLDGRMSTYVMQNSSTNTNIDALSYEWLVKNAPLTSRFEAQSTPLVSTSSASGVWINRMHAVGAL